MEAAIRSSVQVGGPQPPPNGGQSQQQQQQQQHQQQQQQHHQQQLHHHHQLQQQHQQQHQQQQQQQQQQKQSQNTDNGPTSNPQQQPQHHSQLTQQQQQQSTQQQQQAANMSAYQQQQRMPAGASPIHRFYRPVADNTSSYTKGISGGLGPPHPQSIQQQQQQMHAQQMQQHHHHQQQLHQQHQQQQQQQQQSSRSAASPLSPPRPGPGSQAASNAYAKFTTDVNAVREAPQRFILQSAYGIPGPGAQYRDSPYTRIPTIPPVQDYHRVAAALAAAGAQPPPPHATAGVVQGPPPPTVSISTPHGMDSLHFAHPPATHQTVSTGSTQLLSNAPNSGTGANTAGGGVIGGMPGTSSPHNANNVPPPSGGGGIISSGGKRILLPSTHRQQQQQHPPTQQQQQYSNEYLTNAIGSVSSAANVVASAAAASLNRHGQPQAPPDPGGQQPYKKLRLSDATINVTNSSSSTNNTNHLPPNTHQLQNVQPPPPSQQQQQHQQQQQQQHQQQQQQQQQHLQHHHQQQQQQRQPSPAVGLTQAQANAMRSAAAHGHTTLPPHTHLTVLPPTHLPPQQQQQTLQQQQHPPQSQQQQHHQQQQQQPQPVTMQQLKVETQQLPPPPNANTPPINRSTPTSLAVNTALNVITNSSASLKSSSSTSSAVVCSTSSATSAATSITSSSSSSSSSTVPSTITAGTTVTSSTSSSSSSTEAYHPQVEAISPTLPADNAEERGRTAKEELLMQIQKVDTEITGADSSLEALRKKEKSLLDVAAAAKQQKEKAEAARKKAEADAEDDAANSWRSQTLAQKIYLMNRKTAASQHSILDSCGERFLLPLYNQPLDVEHLTTLLKRHQASIKGPLIEHVRKIKQERWSHHTKIVETYTQMSAEWQKRVDKSEASAKRKAREAKNREFFEKVFTELRKQREDKERFNRVGSRIKSEADYEEIMDGLQEQAMEVRKMRSYAVIPPLMYDAQQRKCVYHNENGLVEDMVAVHKERAKLNVWTAGEKEIFKEKFLQHPKNFGAIAASLDRKSAQDCVRYYYLSKKTENYKQLLRKSRQRTRASKSLQKTQQQQTQCIIDSLTTGVTTRLQREQQQKTGGRSAAAERERERAEREKAAEKAATESGKTSGNSKNHKTDSTATETVSTSSDTTTTDTSKVSSSGTSRNTANTASTTQSASTTTTTAAATTTTTSSKTTGDKAATSETTTDATTVTGTAAKTKTSETSNNKQEDTKVDDTKEVKAKKTNDSHNSASAATTTTTTITSDKNSKTSNTASRRRSSSNSSCYNDPLAIMEQDPLAISTESITGTTTATTTTAALPMSSSATVVTNSLTTTTHPPLTTPNGIKTSYAAAMAQQVANATATAATTTTTASSTTSSSITTSHNEEKSSLDAKLTSNNSSSLNNAAASGKDKGVNSSSTSATTTTGNISSTATTTTATTTTKLSANNNNNNNVTTPTTSTTAGNFLGQKLKVAQVESLMGANNNNNTDCNSDVSDPKKKRLDMDNSLTNPNTTTTTNINNNQQQPPNSNLNTSSTTTNTSSNPANINNKNNNNANDIVNAAAASVGGNLLTTAIAAAATAKSNIVSSATTITSTSSSAIITTAGTTTAGTTTTNLVDLNAMDGKDKLATCFVCKAENCPRTRPLKKGRGQQYGIPDDTIPAGARVCNTCQCKSVRTRYPNCPLPTCPNPKDRAKRLRNIPARLYELAPDVRDPIMQEFQIPAQASRCCSACLMRIRRKLDPHVNFTDEERRTDGDESDVSTSSCDEREPGGSDTASVESPENPQRHNSLTKDLVQKPQIQMVANAGNMGPGGGMAVVTINSLTSTTDTNSSTSVSGSGNNAVTIPKSDERLLPPLGHAPKNKTKTSEEYDSSATETADEENENSPANRQSPKVILNSTNTVGVGPNNNNISCSTGSLVVQSTASGLGPPPTSSSINGPLPPTALSAASAASQDPKQVTSRDLQDFLFTVIERSLKQKGPPPSKPTNTSSNQSNQSNQTNQLSNPHMVSGMSKPPPVQLSVDSSNQNINQNSSRRNVVDVISSSTIPTNSSNNSNSSNNNNNSNNSSSNNSNNDVTIVREYRNDGPLKHQPQAHGQPILLGSGSSSSAIGAASANSVQNLNVRQSQQPPPMSSNITVSTGGHPENLATLSVVNSYLPGQHLPPPPPSHSMLHHQQHDIKATITPVMKTGKTSTPPHVVAPSPDTIIYATSSRNNEPEPQTLDLSIKKPSRDGPSPHNSSSNASSSSGGADTSSRHQQAPPPSSSVKHVGNAPSMYRGGEHSPLIGAPPNHAYLYHPHPASVGKVPPPGSLYVSQVPVPMSITQQQPPPGVPVGGASGRGGQSSQPPSAQPPPSHMQMSAAQHGKGMSGVNKMPPKLSPQLIHPPHSHGQAPSPSQQQQQQQQLLVGPKGSITHGTPVNNAAQQIIVHSVPAGATLSPKFDNLLRQTPPSGGESNKLGSITQGTPIHLPAHLDSKRAYEYAYKSSQRQSPAQQQQQQHHPPPPPQQSSPQGPPQNAYTVGPYSRAPYTVEQSPVLSTRQIVMHDYITSQQMQGQQQRNVPRSGSASSAGAPGSGKESPLPRNSTSGLVYYDKERGRTEYSSRASPAEHANSTPSPHRTPPPPRQGVIQRHNTGGSKPPSPAAPPQNRMHVVMSHNYPPAGHEAFSSFVDVAVQQPQLPVPSQKDDKSSVGPTGGGPPGSSGPPPPNAGPPQQPPPPTHHDAIRYQMNRDHHMAALQLQHHHQQQAVAAAAVQHQAAVAAQQHQYRQQHAAAAAADMQRRMEQAKRDQRMHNAAIERDRDMQQKRQERDRIERMNVERLDREREQRERDRDRERDRERERERREQERAAEEREREGRRMERIYAGNAATAAAVAAATGQPHYIRGPPPPETGPPRSIPDRERDAYHRTHTVQPPTEGTFSAQTLIDAIIKHQISQTSTEPTTLSVSRDLARPAFYNSRDIGPPPRHPTNATISSLQAAENNGKSSSSPNIINIDLDSDRTTVASSSSSSSASGGHHSEPPSSRNSRVGPGGMLPSAQGPLTPQQSQSSTQMRTKNITIGELTDKIIVNDYHNAMHLRAPPPHPSNFMPYMQDPQGIIAPDMWKMNRRVQKEAEAAAAAAAGFKGGPPSSSHQQQQQQQQQVVNSNSNPGTPTIQQSGRSTTPGDDRNIIRMPQAHSPRKYMQEFMMQAQDYHYQQQQQQQQQQQHQQQQQSSGPPVSTHGSSMMRGAYDTNPSGVGSSGSSGGSTVGPPVAQNHTFDTMKYVQNRIAEVMRTKDDHGAVSGGQIPNDHHDHHNDHRLKDSRKTPNQYNDDRDGGRRSSSNDSTSHPSSMGGGGSYQPSPVTTFAATTYAYPYSALNVPSSVSGLPPPPQMSLNAAHQMPPTSVSGSHKQSAHVLHGGIGGHDGGPNSVVSTTSGGGGSGGQGGSASEPKPLLSAQYEALSDED